MVAGAIAHHRANYVFSVAPAEVAEATSEWRREADLVLAFSEDRLIMDPEACVLASELLEEFNDWLEENHHRPWSAQTFANRFGGHSQAGARRITKVESRNPTGLSRRHVVPAGSPNRATVWTGIRFRRAEDEPPDD